MRRQLIYIAAAMVMTACQGHNGGENLSADANVLARVDTATLTISQLQAAMPATAVGDDSVRWARSYIRAWIDNHVISDIATEGIDMAEVDRMVQEYRNQLILWQYRRQMFDNEQSGFNADTVRAYYDAHADEFKLIRPLVRGTYIKVPEKSADLSGLRRLYRSDKTDDLDRMEKYAMNSAIHYDNFFNHWIDWDQIEAKIPYDFGANPDAFLRTHKYLDITQGGFTYLLYIKEYLPTGTTMPFEAAQPLVENRLGTLRRQEYDQNLRKALYDKALNDGRVTIFCDLSN